MMTQTIEELAKKRRSWVDAERENDADIKHLLTAQYPDNAHFVYELLQNAEDANAQKVQFILHDDYIEFEHDGKRLFSIQDVDAITNIGRSTKRDDVTKIGKFGVGFKAVFVYTDTPEIKSGKFHFRILDMRVPDVVPKRDSLSGCSSADGKTQFHLPFDNPEKSSDQARREIEKLLKALGATTLLFLTHIGKIEYLLPDLSLGYIERIDLGGSRFEIRVQHPNELAPSSTWYLKFEKEVQIEDEEAETEDQKEKTCSIAVALALSPVKEKANAKGNKGGGEDVTPEWELLPIEPGRVCIYFPADKETSNLRFHLHAPFASTVARDGVRNCAGNNALLDCLADLLAESMSAIRDQGLLTVRALALLPNDKDNLSEFYLPLMDRLVEEFQENELVPMKRGGHAAASRVFSSTRALSELINDDDMVMLLGDGYLSPIWASNPQQNHREDNFLSMLGIERWDTVELVKALGRLKKDALGQWMGSKGEQWHQILYEMLMDYLNAAPKSSYAAAAERKDTIMGLDLIRCSDGTYRKGSDCFFPTGEVEHDDKYPRVAKGTYFDSNEENKKAREFLEMLGVREVDEKVEIESLLREQYSQESVSKKTFRPDINHIKRFAALIQKNPAFSQIFRDFYIFKLESGKWGTPHMVYLDNPFMDTGLRAWYEEFGDTEKKCALSSEYEKCGIKPEKIGEFAKKLRVTIDLLVEKTTVSHKHPEWRYLNLHGGERYSDNGIDEDYSIPGLKDFLASPSIGKSRLIWRTMREPYRVYYSQYLKAHFGRNASNIASAKSTLVHDLIAAKWVPQEIKDEKFEFVSPRDATADKLPEGFEYQTGWQWLHDIEFGKLFKERKEANQLEQERQTAEYKRKEEVARDMGFESSEDAEEIAKLKRENPEEFERLKNEIMSRKQQSAAFPDRPVTDPERRRGNIEEQFSDSPEKDSEIRSRKVRITKDSIMIRTWLRNEYTNDAGQMRCQICKNEHFQKRDGTHYFEIKEVLTSKLLPKEHVSQFLELCPLCFAKYKEFIISNHKAMTELREAIINAQSCEVSISLGKENTSIRFVETHLYDLQTTLDAMD